MVQVFQDITSQTELQTRHARALYLTSLAQPETMRSSKLHDWAKRTLDILFATLLLLALSPLMLTIAILIKATSSGPAILIQERVGKGGRIFPFYKFRSMYDNADRAADIKFAREYIHGKHLAVERWDGVFKPASDGRVTSIGRWLRKTSLDEVPQFFNVLKGDMSLVGPRPSMPYEVDVYKPWHFRRLQVLPGITGLAQIRGRSSLTFQDIVEIDIEYIERSSLLLDLKILLQTPAIVLSGRGAR